MDSIGLILRRVRRPARYSGGEYGAVRRSGDALLRIAISYPDLYEIGMSNHAIRVLYARMNAVEGVACERVFAPDLDLEAELRRTGQRLFTLETRTPLSAVDMIGFSLGYEMTLTNMLAILELGGVPLDSADRGDEHPIVIAGGPVVSNPVPLSRFLDCAYIGEAEQWIEDTLPVLVALKRAGAGRRERLAVLFEHPSVWSPAKRTTTRRAVWGGFGAQAEGYAFPVPNLRIVQDHANVEIMRGCPNGCRFCHAGMFTRPARFKPPLEVAREVETVIALGGYREVTLASLSSADYQGLPELLRSLNRRYSECGVSFSVPSLKVESVGLELVSELARVRRSGLTFAVETPGEARQRGLNKLVPLEKTIAVLREAKSRGWRAAKFYFMVGLPLPGGESEAGAIAELLREVSRGTGLFLNVNVATFIPKPHTPFQWARQLGEEEALASIMEVRRLLPRDRFKVGYHAPFTSVLEGMVSRGDTRAGDLLLEAYRAGARLDAWEERIRWDIWRDVIARAHWDVVGETLRARRLDEPLPWDCIDSGVTRAYLAQEWLRAQRGELSPPCAHPCTRPCGACREGAFVIRPPAQGELPAAVPATADGRAARVLFEFSKRGDAALLSHLDLVGVVERALVRAGFRVRFSAGHNPAPRLEFASPLALGIESEAEVACVEVANFRDSEDFCSRLNRALPEGIVVRRAAELQGTARASLAARVWGSEFQVEWPEAHGLARSLAQHVSAEGPLARVVAGEGMIQLTHRHTQRKGHSILFLLETAAGAGAIGRGMVVRRTRLWGPRGDQPLFDALTRAS